MITFRREHLDCALEKYQHLMRGRVLDVGGVKGKRRGRFVPPQEGVVSWEFLNPDAATNPDYCCPAEKIPLDTASVDTVVMTEVLEYLGDPDAAFAEIFRVLAVDGVALVSVPLLHAVHGDWQGDRQRFTEVKFREMAATAGFKGITIETMGGLGSVVFDLIHAAGGYANQKNKSFGIWFVSKVSRVSAPLFRWLDSMTRHEEQYITTGYFAVLRKGQ